MATADSRKVIFAALIGNTLIAITKFVAAVLTGSSAMASEGIHSLVDTGNQILLLVGLRLSRRRPEACRRDARRWREHLLRAGPSTRLEGEKLLNVA